ncbi:MAG: DUF2147 domain-containing protein [Hyphomicrobiaceae bacterium]
MHYRALKPALYVLGLISSNAAWAASGPTGTWIDHTGRGAVEITECGANLCGRLVWLKDEANKKGCGLQIIGNAKPVGNDRWDGGWILDPEKNAKYSVELKPVGADKLRVLGYMGSKLFSETMIWKRAPADLKRCDDAEPIVTASPASREEKAAPARAQEVAPKPSADANRRKSRDATGGKTARSAEKGRDCKKYFPQIGEVLAVPCDR